MMVHDTPMLLIPPPLEQVLPYPFDVNRRALHPAREMQSTLPDKCAEHGLATGPDGRCVLCRRSAEPGNRRTYLFFGLLFSGMLGLLLVVWGVRNFPDERTSEVVAEASVAAPPTAEDVAPTRPDPTTTPAPVAANPWPSEAAETTPDATERTRRGDVATPTEREPNPQSGQTARERESQIRRAMSDVQVTVYFAPWCPACNRAMTWMKTNGIRFDARNIEASDSAERTRRSLTSSRSIPTIVVEDTVFDGFSAGKVRAAIRREAEKRVDRL